MSFTQTPEHLALRQAVAQLGGSYDYDYMVTKARAGGDMCALYSESGKLGYGVRAPEEGQAAEDRVPEPVAGGHDDHGAHGHGGH